jgi:hypothetical protein
MYSKIRDSAVSAPSAEWNRHNIKKEPKINLLYQRSFVASAQQQRDGDDRVVCVSVPGAEWISGCENASAGEDC